MKKIILVTLTVLLFGCSFSEEEIEEPSETIEPIEIVEPEIVKRFEVLFDENEEFDSSEKEQAANYIDPYIVKAVDILNTLDLEEIEVLDADYNERAKRNSMKENAGNIYDQMLEKVSNFEEFSYDDTIKNDASDFLTALDYLKIDHHELFLYCDFNYKYPNWYSVYYLPNNWMQQHDDIAEIRSKVLVYQETVNRIINKMPANLSNYYKCWYFALVITFATTYDTSLISSSHEFQAYDCLVKGKCACRGYTEAFYELCKAVNIACWRCTGESNDERHSWNMVETKEGDYYIDITWYDDDRSANTYKDAYEEYMFMDEETLSLEHDLEYYE